MGAAIGEGATEGDFLKAMRAAMREKDAADTPLQLFMGDLYNQLKLNTPHGGMREWVLTHFKRNEGVYCNLRKLGCVSAAWPEDLRRPGQSYEFYREGASLSEAWKSETAHAIDRGEQKSAADAKKEKARIAKEENGEISGKVSAPKELRLDLAGLVADRGEEFAALVLRMARSGALDGFLNCPPTPSNVPSNVPAPEHLTPAPKCSASMFTANIAEHLEEADTPAASREHHSRPAANVPAPEHLEAPEDVADAELTEALVEADYLDADSAQEEEQDEESEPEAVDPTAEDPFGDESDEPELESLCLSLDLPRAEVKSILRRKNWTWARSRYLECLGWQNGDALDISPEATRRVGLLRESFDARARERAFPA